MLTKSHLLEIHKFWASHLCQKVAQQNLNLYQRDFRKEQAIYQFVFSLLNQMNCEIIVEGKLGEDNRNL